MENKRGENAFWYNHVSGSVSVEREGKQEMNGIFLTNRICYHLHNLGFNIPILRNGQSIQRWLIFESLKSFLESNLTIFIENVQVPTFRSSKPILGSIL